MKVRSGFKLVIFEFGNVLVKPSLRMVSADINDTTSALALKSDGLRHVFA